MVALEAGAEDVQTEVDVYKVLTAPAILPRSRTHWLTLGLNFGGGEA